LNSFLVDEQLIASSGTVGRGRIETKWESWSPRQKLNASRAKRQDLRIGVIAEAKSWLARAGAQAAHSAGFSSGRMGALNYWESAHRNSRMSLQIKGKCELNSVFMSGSIAETRNFERRDEAEQLSPHSIFSIFRGSFEDIVLGVRAPGNEWSRNMLSPSLRISDYGGIARPMLLSSSLTMAIVW
jgi:hypothetical protein